MVVGHPRINVKMSDLAIRTHGNPRQGSGWCESAWELTPSELDSLISGGTIVLRVWGWQPPVALYVESAPNQPVDEPTQSPDPRSLTACPKCEMGRADPLALFCQHKQCPLREARHG